MIRYYAVLLFSFLLGNIPFLLHSPPPVVNTYGTMSGAVLPGLTPP